MFCYALAREPLGARHALMRPDLSHWRQYVLSLMSLLEHFSVSLMILDDESYSGFRCRQHILPTIHAFPDRNTKFHLCTRARKTKLADIAEAGRAIAPADFPDSSMW